MPGHPLRETLPEATVATPGSGVPGAGASGPTPRGEFAQGAIADRWAAPLAQRIDELCQQLASYLPSCRVQAVRSACWFAADAHAGTFRKSGEPYIFHPLAVARQLAEGHLDPETLMAAVLHDVIEDTAHDKAAIAERFGVEVAELVDGVSKLTQIKFSTRLEAQAENFRKMFLAMARDIRVIMIKLADRLHNMRTLGAMSPEKRRRIARETLEIYVPIAGRLGMERVRSELEDLAFSHAHPLRYRILKGALQRARASRRDALGQMEDRICGKLADAGIDAKVEGFEHGPWQIYCRMKTQRTSLRECYELYGIAVVVDTTDTCYRALGVIHSLYKPLMGRFEDHIAIARANGHQALHTVLFGVQGLPIEVRISTQTMDLMGREGVAAHWLYRDDQGSAPHRRAREWLQQLLDMQRRAGDSVEFLESVKLDMFPAEIYVFTPRGEIVELPQGATVVDFAYAIHSDVGNTCIGAKVNRRLVPLRTTLTNGETVEVIITPTARPNPAWLSFVVTAKARAAIRHYLKNLRTEEAVLFGKRLLEKALGGPRLGDLPQATIDGLVQELKVADFDAVLADIGLGNRLAALVARRLLPERFGEARAGDCHTPLLIRGTEGAVVTFGRCCRPVPGDPIIGFLSAGRGIVIHRGSCRNVTDYQKNPDKWLEVEWAEELKADFPVDLRLIVVNEPGVLATLAITIADLETNIEHIETTERDGPTVTVDLTLNVKNRTHLATIMRHLKPLPEVLRLARKT